jgi:bacteriorhodopsin
MFLIDIFPVNDFLNYNRNGFIAVLTITGILTVLYISVFIIAERNNKLAVIISTLLSCILMFPLAYSFMNRGNYFFNNEQIKIYMLENKLEELTANINEKKSEAKNMIASQAMEIEELRGRIRLLENAE